MPTLRRPHKAAPVLFLLMTPVFAHETSFLSLPAHVSGPPQTFTQRVTATHYPDWGGIVREYDCVPTGWNCEMEGLRWPFTIDFGPLPGEVGVVIDAFARVSLPRVEINATVTEQGPLQEWCGEPGEEYPCPFFAGFYGGYPGSPDRGIKLVGASGSVKSYSTITLDVADAVKKGQTSFEGYFWAGMEDSYSPPCVAENAIGVCQIDFTFTPEFTAWLEVEYTPAAIPEPGTATLAAVCLLALAARIRKR